MSAHIVDATKEGTKVDAQKRAFMKKFGKYAIAGAGMATLMTPTLSSASNYGTGTGRITAEMDYQNQRFVSGTWDTDAIENEDGWMARLEQTETGYRVAEGTISTTDNLQAGTFTGNLWPTADNRWQGQGHAVFQGQLWDWTAIGDPATRNITWTYVVSPI